jgi:hypothetical protein
MHTETCRSKSHKNGGPKRKKEKEREGRESGRKREWEKCA